MEKPKISACYFPTTVLFIDDDRSFLAGLQSQLNERTVIPKFFLDPQEALEFFDERKNRDFVLERCLLHPEGDEIGHRHIEIDIRAISDEIYNPYRFNEVSVIVVDYAIPNTLGGVELCQILRNRSDRPVKLLMLTGETDLNIAIDAFNQGIIDKFIAKNSGNLYSQINIAIQEMQHSFFEDCSQLVIDSLTKNLKPSVHAWFGDSSVSSIFNGILQENDILEYYLTDAYGSFLLIDTKEQPSWFVVKGEDGMQGAYEVAYYSDVTFPDDLLNALKNRQKILYIQEGGFCHDPVLAEKCTHLASKSSGNKAYYYALVKDPNVYEIHRKNILSFKRYLNLNKQA